MKKDSHLAWNVKYAPGAIEARGFKDGKQVMTAKRETTGPAAKLALTADRKEISADGEDVAMFAVEVQDAQGRAVPIADNQVSFRVSGQGKVIGVGNGDPTSHESDKASSRKAFSGLCMALVQSTKTAGNITVEAQFAGIDAGQRHHLRESREAAAAGGGLGARGSGGLGHHRPVETGSRSGCRRPRWRRVRRRSQVFTFRQNGGALTGTVEGGGGGRGGGGETPVAIEDGKVDGANISFKAGNVAYTGTREGGPDRAAADRRPRLRRPRRPASPGGAHRTAPGDRPSARWFGPLIGLLHQWRQRRRPWRANARAAGHYQGEAVVGNCIGPRSLQRGFITAARFRYRGWTALQGKLLISFCQHRQDRKSSNTCTLGPWAAA